MARPDLDPRAVLDDIAHFTDLLATAHRERAVASSAYRKEHSRVWSQLVTEGRSSTEAQRWADAHTIVLRSELDKLDGEIAALDATVALHRDTLTTALTLHSHDTRGS